MHYLGEPLLAGLAEIERTAPEDPSRWDDERIRKAIGFYYCTAHGNYRPRWYRRLLQERPEIVADVQVRFAVSEFRSDREPIDKLWELAYDHDHAKVARHASLRLLRAFPTRCTVKQIESLDCLLWAAIQHTDRPGTSGTDRQEAAPEEHERCPARALVGGRLHRFARDVH